MRKGQSMPPENLFSNRVNLVAFLFAFTQTRLGLNAYNDGDVLLQRWGRTFVTMGTYFRNNGDSRERDWGLTQVCPH